MCRATQSTVSLVLAEIRAQDKAGPTKHRNGVREKAAKAEEVVG